MSREAETWLGSLHLPLLNTAAFIELTRKVQMMLYALGYYSGAINGRVNPETSSAISSYQSKNGLKVTGKIDDNLVKSLNVPVQ